MCCREWRHHQSVLFVAAVAEQMNTLNFINPYRYEGMWVFDDPRVGLDKEPFVSGADTMIDVLVKDIPGAEKGFPTLGRPAYAFLSRGTLQRLCLTNSSKSRVTR